MIIDDLKKRINGKDVYIIGTRIAGLSVAKVLSQNGIVVKAFVDNIGFSGKKAGLNVILQSDFIKEQDNKFAIICTKGHSANIAKTLSCDYVEWVQKFDYYIEINNRCNLNCLTCFRNENYKKPLADMNIIDFTNMLNKIRKEDPQASWLNLFGHNEAFLNGLLPKMITLSRSLGFHVGLSTNLAFRNEFVDVIKSKPLWLRVSLSGWGDNYEVIHRGGVFNVLYNNLIKLRDYRDKYSKDTQIEIFFHRYKHNENDISKIKELCMDLGFEFRSIIVSLIGLETVVDILDGKQISRKAQEALPYLSYSVSETADRAYKQSDIPCPYEKMVRIQSDLSIAVCQPWMGDTMKENFMDISYEKLEYELKNTKYCSICRPKVLHQFCEVIYSENE